VKKCHKSHPTPRHEGTKEDFWGKRPVAKVIRQTVGMKRLRRRRRAAAFHGLPHQFVVFLVSLCLGVELADFFTASAPWAKDI
jgi:hypothetical protein